MRKGFVFKIFLVGNSVEHVFAIGNGGLQREMMLQKQKRKLQV